MSFRAVRCSLRAYTRNRACVACPGDKVRGVGRYLKRHWDPASSLETLKPAIAIRFLLALQYDLIVTCHEQADRIMRQSELYYIRRARQDKSQFQNCCRTEEQNKWCLISEQLTLHNYILADAFRTNASKWRRPNGDSGANLG